MEVRYWTGLLSKRGARVLGRRQNLARPARPAPQRGSSVGLWREKGMGVTCPGLRCKMADRRSWRAAVEDCGEVRVVFLKVHRTCKDRVKVKGIVKDKDKV